MGIDPASEALRLGERTGGAGQGRTGSPIGKRRHPTLSRQGFDPLANPIGPLERRGQDPDRLIRLADAAMYRAKNAGKNGYRFAAPADLPPADL